MSVDIEQLALANLLLGQSEAFVLEASRWRDAGSRAYLNRTAQQLAHIGRLTLRGEVDLERGEAFAEAGRIVLNRIKGARLLAETIEKEQQK